MKPKRARPDASEPNEDEAEVAAPLPAPEARAGPREGLPVVALDALAKLEAKTAHPIRALLWLLVSHRKQPAEAIALGSGYRGTKVRLATPASGEEGTRFESAGLALIGSLRERGGLVVTTSDVHVSENGAVHALVRQTRARTGVAATLSSYYLFSVLSDGTVVETVQAERPYLDSTPQYVCRGGSGRLEDDVRAHEREVARLCRTRGVYVLATRDLDDVVRQQRHSYRHALPLSSALLTLTVALAPFVGLALVAALVLAFFL